MDDILYIKLENIYTNNENKQNVNETISKINISQIWDIADEFDGIRGKIQDKYSTGIKPSKKDERIINFYYKYSGEIYLLTIHYNNEKDANISLLVREKFEKNEYELFLIKKTEIKKNDILFFKQFIETLNLRFIFIDRKRNTVIKVLQYKISYDYYNNERIVPFFIKSLDENTTILKNININQIINEETIYLKE